MTEIAGSTIYLSGRLHRKTITLTDGRVWLFKRRSDDKIEAIAVHPLFAHVYYPQGWKASVGAIEENSLVILGQGE